MSRCDQDVLLLCRQADTFKAIAHIPWMIKPLYGFVTDTFPVMGCRRRPYLIICGLSGLHHPRALKLMLRRFLRPPSASNARHVLSLGVRLGWEQSLFLTVTQRQVDIWYMCRRFRRIWAAQHPASHGWHSTAVHDTWGIGNCLLGCGH